MNWLHFFLWVGAVYLLYYLALILFDVAGGRHKVTEGPQTHELTFSEDVLPAQMGASAGDGFKTTPKTRRDEAARDSKQEPDIINSGGIVIDNLFRLCKQEAIIYTRSVSF